jgi:hypothetical protein
MPACGNAPPEHEPGIALRPRAAPASRSGTLAPPNSLETGVTTQDPEVRPPDTSQASKTSETAKVSNLFGLLAVVTESKEMTANLERLIWSMSGLLALAIGLISAIGIVALHYPVAGSVSLATATIISLVARFRLRKKRDSH